MFHTFDYFALPARECFVKAMLVCFVSFQQVTNMKMFGIETKSLASRTEIMLCVTKRPL